MRKFLQPSDIACLNMSMKTPIWNFSAGPAKLPESVLQHVQDEWFNWQGTGVNILEVSHRTPEFETMIDKVEHDLRHLLDVPSNYKILFLQGGATTQFSAIPLNFLGRQNMKVDYCVTGAWSQKAAEEASRYTQNIHYVLNANMTDGFKKLGSIENMRFSDDAAYAYYCENETIHGVQFHHIPRPSSTVPLIVDMSSSFLTQPIDVSRFGMIFAGAQKNVGPSGLVVAIIRDDLLDMALPYTPCMLNYTIHAQHRSMYNTPPTFAIYVAGRMFEWLLEQGGLETMQQRCREKAQMVYDVIDDSNDFYQCPVDRECRSWINIPFRIRNGCVEEETRFYLSAEKEGLLHLKGHRSMGGLRVSIYNAMPVEGVRKLVNFMLDFKEASAI
jgi:phosphoserine aminotransferase